MTTYFIANLAVVLPSRFAPGDVLDDVAASVLHHIWLKRLNSRLRWLKDRGEIDAQGIQARALELAQMDLAPYSIADDAEDDDPVLLEALAMAKSIISSRMAEEGLPPPKGLDTHAKALVDAMPSLVEKARLRVEARYQAAAQGIEGMTP